jgi:hypothetical protein
VSINGGSVLPQERLLTFFFFFVGIGLEASLDFRIVSISGGTGFIYFFVGIGLEASLNFWVLVGGQFLPQKHLLIFFFLVFFYSIDFSLKLQFLWSISYALLFISGM